MSKERQGWQDYSNTQPKDQGRAQEPGEALGDKWRGKSTAFDVGSTHPALKIDLNEGHPGLNDLCTWFMRLQRGAITEEKLQKCEQYWREEYKTWDKQKLQESIKQLEERYTDYLRRFPEEYGHHFTYEIELKRQELRQRKKVTD